MRFARAIKHITLACALAGAGYSHAALIAVGDTDTPLTPTLSAKLLPSTGTLAFSNLSDDPTYNLMVIASMSLAQLSATGAAVPHSYTDAANNDHFDLAASLQSLNVDGTTGKITDLYFTGGVTMTTVKGYANGVGTNGGSLTISDFHGDLSNGILYAHVTGTNACFDLPATASAQQKSAACGFNALTATPAYAVDSVIPLFTWAALSGSGSIALDAQPGPAGLQITLSGLNATAEARAALISGLSLKSVVRDQLAGVTNFGSLAVDINLDYKALDNDPTAPPIPEPSSYALMGLGLAVIGGIARRRRRARASAHRHGPIARYLRLARGWAASYTLARCWKSSLV